jgi:hypothetical protein
MDQNKPNHGPLIALPPLLVKTEVVGIALDVTVLLLGDGKVVWLVGTEILYGAQTIENRASKAMGLLVSPGSHSLCSC